MIKTDGITSLEAAGMFWQMLKVWGVNVVLC